MTTPNRLSSLSKILASGSILALSTVLTACGGGGSSSSPSSPPPPPPPVNSAPRLTGNITPNFAENTTVSFTLNVEDDDGDDVTVTIGNSNDGQFFTLNTETGEIRSTQTFNFEIPEDVDGNNVYEQTVTLNDGTVSVTRTVRVTITDVDEAPTCNQVMAANIDENQTGVLGTISGTDPDAGDDDDAVVENFMVSDDRLNGLVSVSSTTGQVTLDTALDAEAYEADFTFTISADYRTSSLFDTCSFDVSLNDLPTRVTSGLKFDENLRNAQKLNDLNAGGTGEFWVADATDNTGTTPASGTLVFGETLLGALAATGAGEFDYDTLTTADRIEITAPFQTGAQNATTLTVKSMSDIDGDGIGDLLIAGNQLPNDGLAATRRPWAYIVFAKTIADNVSGAIELSTLSNAEALSLTGPVDMNGSLGDFEVANLDGVAGDELIISAPGTMTGFAGAEGRLYIVDGAEIIAANGNLDFDLAASTKQFDSPFTLDPEYAVSNIDVIGDLSGDGNPELLGFGTQTAVLYPSENILANNSGTVEDLNPLLLELEGERPQSYAQADVDGDAVADLLLTRGTGAAGRQASVVFADALSPIINSDSQLTLSAANFNTGDYLDLSSSGTGENPDPIRIGGVGDLDGDGKEEVAFSVRLDTDQAEQGTIYILRGSALSDQSIFNVAVDDFTAAKGTRLRAVPFLFQSVSTKLTLTPDIDGDGLDDFYLTSNKYLQKDPEGLGLLLKSSDVSAALNGNETDVDLEALFFNETPE